MLGMLYINAALHIICIYFIQPFIAICIEFFVCIKTLIAFMDPSHNSFAVLGNLSPNQTSNPNTLSHLSQINTNTTNTSSQNNVFNPKPVFSNKQSAFTHYNASTSNSAHKRTKQYFPNHCPKLATGAARSRHSFLKSSVHCGSLVQFYENSELLKVFQYVKLEPLICLRYKSVCYTLIQEFYCNLETHYGWNGEKFLTSVIDGNPILVTHEVISKALGLNYKVSKQPIMDITQAFAFNKNEYHLYLSTFCKSDIPVGKFDSDEAISYEYFAPEFQVLALIYRANIFPKPNYDKLFNFLDVKIMFLLLTDKLNFNVSYMILLNMVSATHLSFMPYGLLLSCLFSHLKLDVSSYPSQKVYSVILEKTARNQIPLSQFVSASESGLNVYKCIANHAFLVGKVEEFQKSVGIEIEELRGKLINSVYKLNKLADIVYNLEHKVELLEQHSENQYEILKKLNVDDDMVVPNMGPVSESVYGRNVNGDDGMEEGEVAVEQH